MSWPKHPDGRPMKLGEMTPEQREKQIKRACRRLQREFEHPLVQEKIRQILEGKSVSN